MLVVRALTGKDVDAVAALHVRTWQAGYAAAAHRGYPRSDMRHARIDK
jgi:hypothetical protein